MKNNVIQKQQSGSRIATAVFFPGKRSEVIAYPIPADIYYIVGLLKTHGGERYVK